MKYSVIIVTTAVAAITPLFVAVYYNNRSYHEPYNAWKCTWNEPVDPADKRACAAIPDKWLGEQFARCMVTLKYTSKCPNEVNKELNSVW